MSLFAVFYPRGVGRYLIEFIYSISLILGLKGSRAQGFKGSRVQELMGSRAHGFKGSEAHGFKGSRAQGFNSRYAAFKDFTAFDLQSQICGFQWVNTFLNTVKPWLNAEK